MGYLLYLDALGMQSIYNSNPDQANCILEKIISSSRNILDNEMPGDGIKLKNNVDVKLIIMNDSVFFYSLRLEFCLVFASKLMRRMFLIDNNEIPIGFRGSLAKTTNAPRFMNINEGCLSVNTIVVDNITSAMIADKSKILGARVLIPKKLIEESNYPTWDARFQYLIFSPKKSMQNVTCTMIHNENDKYFDLAWTLPVKVSDFERFDKSIYKFWENAALNEHASLHASATKALYEASKNRRNAYITVTEILRNGLIKTKEVNGLIDYNLKEFEDCIQALNLIRKHRDEPTVVGIE